MTTEERLEKLEREWSAAKLPERVGALEEALETQRQEVAQVRKDAAQGQAQTGAGVLARAFVLVDENGKRRAALTAGENGPELGLYDEDGVELGHCPWATAGQRHRQEECAMTTEERLEKVERELSGAKRRNRFMWAVVGAAGVVVVAWAFTRATPVALGQGTGAVSKTLRANAFVLLDEKGQPRAKLAVDEYGPRLLLLDENGEVRAALSAFEDGPRLTLFDERGVGARRATLAVDKDGEPWLVLFDEKGAVLGRYP